MSDATALALAIAEGRTSARAVMEATLDACTRQAELGAVARLLPREQALALATAPVPGPFSGVPMLAKDLGSFASGLAPAAGSAALRRLVKDPLADSAFFTELRAFGLIPMGLSTTPEFGFSLNSEPPDGPIARNPFDPDLSPGGSSGGAAAAVACGIVALAHATDAAGSIRVPAACCGLWGLKPSRDATPMGPDFGNYLMGVVGEFVLARSLRDIATLFHGFNPVKVPVRDNPTIALAIPDRCDASQREAVRAVAQIFQRQGATIVERPAPDVLGAEAHQLVGRILAVSLAEWLAAYGIADADISPLAAANAARGHGIDPTQVFAMTRQVQQITDLARALLDNVDAILSPILSGPPPAIGALPMDHGDIPAHLAALEAIAPNAALANAAGLPALAIPVPTDGGLPTAVQLIGPRGTDTRLLSMAGRIADILPPVPYPSALAGMPT